MAPKKRSKKQEETPDSTPVYLTGSLSKLPTETVIDIVTCCDPRAAIRLLSTCRALRVLSQESETYIFRKLYHNLIISSYFSGLHFLYSPRRNKVAAKGDVVEYPSNKALPAEVIFSRKDQFVNMVAYLRAEPSISPVCMGCNYSETKFQIIPDWGLRLCQLCFAKNLVTKSNLSTYSVTENDARGLKTLEYSIGVSGGPSSKVHFYSALQLATLAREKHGKKYDGPRATIETTTATRQYREHLVEVACLLHGGVRLEDCIKITRTEEDPIDIFQEFRHFISGKALVNKENILQKPRPIEEILTDFVDIVRHAQGKDFDDKTPSERRISPASTPGTLVPLKETVLAYDQLIQTLSEVGYTETVIFYFPSHSEERQAALSALQEYVLNPNEDALARFLRPVISYYTQEYGRRERLSETTSSFRDYNDIYLGMNATFDLKLSAAQQQRLQQVLQISTIMGKKSDVSEAYLLCTSESEQWGYYYVMDGYRTAEVLQEVYYTTAIENRWSLERYASKLPGKPGISFNSEYGAIRLTMLSPRIKTYQRVDRCLSDRIKSNRAEAEKAIDETMKLYREGIISPSALKASVINLAFCNCSGDSKCTGVCWVSNISDEADMEEEDEAMRMEELMSNTPPYGSDYFDDDDGFYEYSAVR